MFASPALAARIEHAEASLSAEVGAAATQGRHAAHAFVLPVGGGVAVFAGPDSPVNKVIGAGFTDPPDPDTLADIETRFRAHAAPVQAEVSTMADPAWHEALGRRGYLLAGFENVLGLDLATWAAPRGLGAPAVEVRPCEPHEDGIWLDAVATGFASPDEVPAQPTGQDVPRDAIAQVFDDLASATGFTRYLALVNGRVAGGASVRHHAGVAQLCGAATLPAFRRQGVQTALLRARLTAARHAGCDLAVVTTAPGSPSMHNAVRSGFSLLYARAVHRLE